MFYNLPPTPEGELKLVLFYIFCFITIINRYKYFLFTPDENLDKQG